MGNMGLPRLSVVIITYQRWSFLARCLRSLEPERNHIFQVIVIDASPEDHGPEASAIYEHLLYVHAPDLAGHMTRSRNRGLMHVTGDVVAFLDDDVVVRQGWASAVQRAFAEEDIDALAGRTCNGIPGEEQAVEPIGSLREDGRLTAGFAASQVGRQPVQHGIGANMAFTRAVLATLGGFRDDYPGTALREDTDIFLRIGQLNGNILFDAAAAVDHLPAPHVHGRRFDTRYKLYGRRNHMVLLSRYAGWASPMVWRWVAGQFADISRAGSMRRKVERFGVTAIGVIWGLGSSVRQAGWRPTRPQRTGQDADSVRTALAVLGS